MTNTARKLASRALLSLGWEVHRKREPLSFLSFRNIKTVLDIGANQGQFARKIRSVCPQAKIYSFEPLPHIFPALEAIKISDSNFEAVNQGLGEESGEVDFEANDFSASSSMLGITPRGLEAFPFTARTSRIRVSVTTLDDWVNGRTLSVPMLIKIDVQGFEDRVIRGGERTIALSEVVICEVSFVSLYENQPLFGDIYAKMCAMGFRFAGMIDNATDPATGEILQADAIFVSSGV